MTAGIIMLIVSIALFLFLMVMVLPKMILKVQYSVGEIEDRGLKKYIYKGKNCILYECGGSVSDHIKQYLIIDEGKNKLLRCKLAHSMKYLNYDIVVFDKYNRIRKIINVKELIASPDFARRVELPKYTSHIKLVLRQVDSMAMKKRKLAFVPGKRVFLYGLSAFLTTALAGFMVKVSCAYTFGGVFRESFIRTKDAIALDLLIAIVIGIISLIIVAFNIRSYSRR
ncbi:MAG: hypothetical protein IJW54_00610 [Clostridia bacterium]|nr:hypothetical protein [Clostridia bacterium]